MQSYRTLASDQPLTPAFATAVGSRVGVDGGEGVRVTDLALVPEPARGSL